MSNLTEQRRSAARELFGAGYNLDQVGERSDLSSVKNANALTRISWQRLRPKIVLVATPPRPNAAEREAIVLQQYLIAASEHNCQFLPTDSQEFLSYFRRGDGETERITAEAGC